MAEPRPFHLVLLSQVQGAVVTRAAAELPDGVSIPRSVLESAGFVPFEKVELACGTTGARLSLQISAEPEGSNLVSVNGAAAHVVQPGDVITLTSWGWLREKPARRWAPTIIALGPDNTLPTAMEPKRARPNKASAP